MTNSASARPGGQPRRVRGRSLNALALQLSAVALSFILVALLVVHTSQQAFTATTNNNSDTVTAASVGLTDNDANGAMFNVSGLLPGQTVYKCITVTYTGTIAPTTVQLYSTGTPTGTLAPYLNLTIDQGPGTNDGFANFTSYTSTPAAVYTGTLSGFSAYTGYSSAVSTGWTPSAGTSSETFRFGVSVQDNNSAQGLTTTFGFQWETRSS